MVERRLNLPLSFVSSRCSDVVDDVPLFVVITERCEREQKCELAERGALSSWSGRRSLLTSSQMKRSDTSKICVCLARNNCHF